MKKWNKYKKDNIVKGMRIKIAVGGFEVDAIVIKEKPQLEILVIEPTKC